MAGPPPLCFNRTEFLSENFDANLFVAKLRGDGVPLDELKGDLSKYFQSLKNELVELINRDYADFVNLSSNLAGIDDVIRSLSVPLRRYSEEVEALRSHLSNTVEGMEDLLSRRRALADKRRCTELLVSVEQSHRKCLDLLAKHSRMLEADASNAGDANSHGSSSDLIGRIATEIVVLRSYVQQVSQSDHCEEETTQQVLQLSSNVASSLENRLQAALQSSLASRFDADEGSKLVLAAVLKAFSVLGQQSSAEDAYRRSVVAPFVNEHLSETRFLSKCTDGHVAVYAHVMEFVAKEVSVMRAAQAPEPSSHFPVIANCLWPEICSGLNKVKRIHEYIVLDQFSANFTAAMDFVTQLEGQCADQDEVELMRGGQMYRDFMKKWDLPLKAYFQLRFQEIIANVDASLILGEDQNFKPNSQGGEVLLDATQSIVNALKQCWRPGVILQPLLHRFLQLSLQLLARYPAWLLSICVSPVADTLVLAVADLNTLASLVPTFQQEAKEAFLAVSRSPNLDSQLSTPYEDAKSQILSCASQLGLQIASQHATRCCEALLSVRGITAMYRMTNKPSPTKPSLFLPSLLQSWSKFCQTHKTRVSEQALSQWTLHLATLVSARYVELVNELLNTVKKTEESLKKLKRGGASAEPTTGLSDTDKIWLQLLLDSREFTRQLTNLNVDVHSLESCSELAVLVQPAERFLAR